MRWPDTCGPGNVLHHVVVDSSLCASVAPVRSQSLMHCVLMRVFLAAPAGVRPARGGEGRPSESSGDIMKFEIGLSGLRRYVWAGPWASYRCCVAVSTRTGRWRMGDMAVIATKVSCCSCLVSANTSSLVLTVMRSNVSRAYHVVSVYQCRCKAPYTRKQYPRVQPVGPEHSNLSRICLGQSISWTITARCVLFSYRCLVSAISSSLGLICHNARWRQACPSYGRRR